MAQQKSSGTWIWVLVLLLIILHQDNWLWENDTMVLGFMPIGLFFHAGISVAAATTWFLGTKFAWPEDIDVSSGATNSNESKPEGEH
ncbi:MAG: DUF3311 domain-containing protein [Planctomycetota bacterium]